MADPVDWEDPCAALAALRPVYYALMSGSQVQEVEFQAGAGASRRVRYTQTSTASLAGEIAKLERLCAEKQSGRRRPGQFAIVAG